MVSFTRILALTVCIALCSGVNPAFSAKAPAVEPTPAKETRADKAQDAPIPKGEPFPDIPLDGVLTSQQQAALGLMGPGPFKLTDIKQDSVLIEIFSMYCPHCQREAPSMNTLAAHFSANPKTASLAVIGIGAGNSQLEVDLFRDKYQVTFPLFIDTDLKLHAVLGNPGTPYFYLVSLKDRKRPLVLLSHEGRMTSVETFEKEVMNALGQH